MSGEPDRLFGLFDARFALALALALGPCFCLGSRLSNFLGLRVVVDGAGIRKYISYRNFGVFVRVLLLGFGWEIV